LNESLRSGRQALMAGLLRSVDQLASDGKGDERWSKNPDGEERENLEHGAEPPFCEPMNRYRCESSKD
jgi:hypothetical protein